MSAQTLLLMDIRNLADMPAFITKEHADTIITES
jgi:hypothetical protein